MTEQLKPCPFCGGEAEISEGRTGDDKPWFYVECSECAACGPNVNYASHKFQINELLAVLWNTRNDPA